MPTPPLLDDDSIRQPEHALSIHELNLLIKEVLQNSFGTIWVTGEISDLARPQSGHVYLTLKDEQAQVRGVLWRGDAAKVRFPLEDGAQVLCRCTVDVYPPRGSYQLVIRHMEPRGEGTLQAALRKLKDKLEKAGLFDPRHKQPLPAFPRRIAVVTSPTGAALHDFLQVARRRWQGTHILVLPAKVQGEGSAAEVSNAIKLSSQLRPKPDILVVTRGGGSMEDLFSFNEEAVVRAIFECPIPTISAIGHEIDVTLADLVADVRALTPSEAAELAVPSSEAIRRQLAQQQARLTGALRHRAAASRARYESLANRRVMRQPYDMVRDLSRRLDELQMRSFRAMERQIERSRQHVKSCAGRIHSLSPLAVLGRGYSLTQTVDGVLLRSSSEVNVNDTIVTQLAAGKITSRVTQK